MPSTLRGYLFFVLCLLILAFTMALHITLSAESMRLDQELASLEEEYARTERINANLVWEISQSTSLAAVSAQAAALGYLPVTEFKYVVMGAGTGADNSPDTGADSSTVGAGSDWSIAPSAENPVVVFSPGGATGSPNAGLPQDASPFETPGMVMSNPQAAQTEMSVQNGAPTWRDTFDLEGLRAATGETWSWIQDRLPRWRRTGN